MLGFIHQNSGRFLYWWRNQDGLLHRFKDYKDPLSMSLGNCVRLYGVGAFKRVNLLYFNTVDDALIQEKRVVDHQWVRDRRTLNLKIGGIKPPRRVGEKMVIMGINGPRK